MDEEIRETRLESDPKGPEWTEEEKGGEVAEPVEEPKGEVQGEASSVPSGEFDNEVGAYSI